MGRLARARGAAAAAVALCAAACTTAANPEAAVRAGSASASPPAVSSSPAPPAPRAMPLALVTRATLPRIDVPRTVADSLLAGRMRDGAAIGLPGGRIRLVTAPEVTGLVAEGAASAADAVHAAASDPRVVAAVPADAVTPAVRAMRVGGVDPLRDPARYPILVAGDAPRPPVTITIVGDVMLARRVGRLAAARRDWSLPFRHVAARLAAVDIAVANLESTFARGGRAIQPASQAFAADPRARAGLSAAGIDLLSLANNHAADFGRGSLVATLRLLEEGRLPYVGAGRDERDARQPAILERGGMRFGFLAFNAIGETPPPGPAEAGAVRIRMQPRLGRLNAADLDAFLGSVRALRPRVDALVVLPHWGAQYSHAPHADQVAVARAALDAGADAVVGGHSHWTGGMEMHDGKLVAYSLGNFIFDMDFSRKTQEGLMLEMVFWGGRLLAAEPVPVRIDATFAPRVAGGAEAASILRDVWRASGPPFRS